MSKPKIFNMTAHLGIMVGSEKAYKKPTKATRFPFRNTKKKKKNAHLLL